MEATVTARLCGRRRVFSALARHAAALVILIVAPVRAGAEPPFGDLPPGIRKAQPSGSVPADLPGSRTDPCALHAGVTLFVPVRRGALAEVNPGVLADADGGPCGNPSAAEHPNTAAGALVGEARE